MNKIIHQSHQSINHSDCDEDVYDLQQQQQQNISYIISLTQVDTNNDNNYFIIIIVRIYGKESFKS